MNIMEEIDKAFVSVYARHRRRYPGASIDDIWQKATYEFSGFVVFPCAAAAILLLIIVHTVVAWGFPLSNILEHDMKWIGIVGCVLFVIYLDRRFKKYLLAPPPLSVAETEDEASRIKLLRLGGPSAFAVTVVLAYVLHKAGATP